MPKQPIIRAFFDEPTNTVSYLVADPATKKAAVIDPVLDYDHKSGEVDTRSVEAMLQAGGGAGLTIVWALETHAHADHLSGAPYIKAKTGAKIGIGEHIKDVQRIFRPIFNATDLETDGSDFDHLFRDGERFNIGELRAEMLYTPGHTPADISLQDRGCGIRRRHAVHAGLRHRARGFSRRRRPPALSLDQAAAGAAPRNAPVHVPRLQGARPRAYAWETTVQQQREKNVHVEERRDGRRVRRDAGEARRDAVGAEAPAAFNPGQHPCRKVSSKQSQRSALSAHSRKTERRR